MKTDIPNPQTETLRRQVRKTEKQILIDALSQYDSRDDAAMALGLSRTTLWRKMDLHDLL
jgi:transcriptional regulator with PAS, ATPase and Fis domain